MSKDRLKFPFHRAWLKAINDMNHKQMALFLQFVVDYENALEELDINVYDSFHEELTSEILSKDPYNNFSDDVDKKFLKITFENAGIDMFADFVAYIEKRERSRENGKKGGRPPKEPTETHGNPVGYLRTQDNQGKPDKTREDMIRQDKGMRKADFSIPAVLTASHGGTAVGLPDSVDDALTLCNASMDDGQYNTVMDYVNEFGEQKVIEIIYGCRHIKIDVESNILQELRLHEIS